MNFSTQFFAPSPLAVAFIGLLAIGNAFGQVPAVPVAFPNVTQVPGTLLYRSPTQQNRITNIIYHNGSFYTNMVTGADRKVWTFSNPAVVSSFGTRLSESAGDFIPLFNDHGNHAHTKVGDYFGGQFGFGIKRQSPGVNVFSPMPDADLTEGPNPGHNLYFPWRIPFHWVQYAGMNTPTPTTINRPILTGANTYTSQSLFDWDSLAEDGVTGNSILLGNLLFITSDNSNLGILAYDISPVFKVPAERPILLDKLVGNFGAYIAVPFEHYILLSNQDSRRIDVIDYQDPTDLKLVTSIDVAGNRAMEGDISVSYVQAQDNFIFAQRHKVNMDTFTPVLELSQSGVNRPVGSVGGVIDTSQYTMPVGNLLFTGGYSFGDADRLGIWAHQAAPDTKSPYVGYHMPRPGQTNFPIGAPISLLIHETLESYTIINGTTIILREAGTTIPLDCWTSFSHDDVLTITPKQYLGLNKTYEVVVVAGGIKDACGNGIEPYSFTFSTGASVNGGNAAPVIQTFTAAPSPTAVNTAVTLAVTATDPDSDPLQYRFTFGDATPTTAWAAAPTSISHTYTSAGHYEVKVQVRDSKPGGTTSVVTKSLTVTVANLPTGVRPTNSSSIALNTASRRVWAVNPDADTVTVLNADTNAKVAEYNLATLLGDTGSIDPRNVAIDSAGNAWISCFDADRVAVLSPTGSLLTSISTGYGSSPHGVTITPNGTSAFVTLTGNGILKRYSTATRLETGSLLLGPTARAIAITGDNQQVLVTRFVSKPQAAEVWNVANTTPLSLTRTMTLSRNRVPDSQSNGRGIPNQLAGITISPNNEWAWITSSKMNDEHGLFFTGKKNPDSTVRAMVSRIRLSDGREFSNNQESNMGNRLDVDNSESPTAVMFSPRGDWAFVALQGNNEIAVFDELSLQSGDTKATRWRFPTDLAPQGGVIDATTNRLFVNNFMARNVSIHNLTDFFASGSRAPSSVKVDTVATEKLSAPVLDGKKTFYNAALKDAFGQDRMSKETYISCSTCHVDGSMDGRTWDFTQRGEGFRNTTDLRGRAGMGHGNVHWSGNFDEIQDFENDIREHFGGTGLMAGPAISTPLGSPKAGLNSTLDNLAAYVTSLDRSTIPKSPFRNPDGSQTAAAVAGRQVFLAQSCTDCHGGANYTNSRGGVGVIPRLQNLGTLSNSSGDRLGAFLAGIDTPTLLGIHATAPYFHDGSAATLSDVFKVAGGLRYQAENATLSGGVSTQGFININYDNAVHQGNLLYWDSAGTATFSNVNGGPGSGVGALEVRYECGNNRNLAVTVNGTSYSIPLVSAPTPGWRNARVEGVFLSAGATNTIILTNTNGLYLDDMLVSNANNLVLAQPHRRVASLPVSDQANLLAYLQQLDGSSPAAPDKLSGLVTFRTENSLDLGGAQDAVTPASDGVENLLKYAFNMVGSGAGQAINLFTPNASILTPTGSAGLPLIRLDANGRLQVTHIRRALTSSSGLVYRVEFSSDLTPGSWVVNSSATTTASTINSLLERVTVTDSSVLPRRFARVAVSSNVVDAPIIISPIAVTASMNTAFSYRIEASDGPNTYSATGLPAGLTLNLATGVITGAATAAGVYPITVQATNSGGTVTSSVTITVTLLPPVITSAGTASGTMGVPFTFQVTGSQFIASYSATGLPAGLSINTTTGLISGTPLLDGIFNASITVTNAAASDTKALAFTVNFIPGPNPVGVKRDYWIGVIGSSIPSLTSDPRFPASPSGSDVLPRLRATNWANPTQTSEWADHYGQRLRGYITAPATGNYQFWVASDDASEVWISTNDSPSNRVRVAWVSSWTNELEWDKGETLNQRSGANAFTFNGGTPGVITLTAGSRYYVEVLHKEGGGGDHVAVAWRTPSDGAGALPSRLVPTSVLTPVP